MQGAILGNGKWGRLKVKAERRKVKDYLPSALAIQRSLSKKLTDI